MLGHWKGWWGCIRLLKTGKTLQCNILKSSCMKFHPIWSRVLEETAVGRRMSRQIDGQAKPQQYARPSGSLKSTCNLLFANDIYLDKSKILVNPLPNDKF